MALYRCKLRLFDPLLKVFTVVPLEKKYIHVGMWEAPDLEQNDEALGHISKENLPLEYEYSDLIGLELRRHQIRQQFSGTFATAIELLVGETKLIFFEDDLEKIA